MTPARVARFWHTVRHLRAIQFAYRAKYWLLRGVCIRTDVDDAVCGEARASAQTAYPDGPIEYLGFGRLRFLNREGNLSQGWQPRWQSRLWLYNLHYFNYLHQQGRARHREELAGTIDAWIRLNPVGSRPGWEPYPLSLRIVNWTKWAASGLPLDTRARRSLYLQARYLAKRLEYHLLGNHLFANAKALIHAGIFFRTSEATRWLDTGLRIMRREVGNQVLSDGGHAELSPMYHAIFVEDLLDILNICSAERVGPRAREAAQCMECARAVLPAMLQWLRDMCHPDGEVAFFNDAAMGIAKQCVDLFAYAQRLDVDVPAPRPAPALTALGASGYVRAEHERYVALLDIARIGPDYQPGHGHADTLSFELSLSGRRLIVHAGTSTYAQEPRRAYERSTEAHNSVVVAGKNSSDVWSSFRVGRRAYPRHLTVRKAVAADAPRWTVSATHTGYRHLRGGIEHRRCWIAQPDSLIIIDWLCGAHGKSPSLPGPAYATLRFAPGFDAAASGDVVTVTSRNGTACRIVHTAASIDILDEFYAPQFGLLLPCKVVRLHFDGPDLTTQLSFDVSL
ncbi:heparinase II/III family protein [Bordetella bronchialis]|uniref:heparinase II/III family protein n=1 Tax=Bordetella bronchialis TaxID=463025 RepID=UPI003CFFB00D